MPDKEELETLVRLADEKIREYEEFEPKKLPPNSALHFKNALDAVLAGMPVDKGDIEVINAAYDLVKKNVRIIPNLTEGVPRLGTGIRGNIIDKHFGVDMTKFFYHGGVHLQMTIVHMAGYVPSINLGKAPLEMQLDPDFYTQLFARVTYILKKVSEMHAHPWRLVRYIAKSKLGIEQVYSPVSLRKHMVDCAEILSPRFMARVFYEPNPNTPLKQSIVILGEDMTIQADDGLIWSVVYNNLKNSQKKFSEQESRMLPRDYKRREAKLRYLQNTKERTSYVSCNGINGSYVALTFWDNGTPLDLNKMLSLIRRAMQDRNPDSLDWVTPEMKQRFRKWSTNDYAFNLLTMEDVSNVAFMARMSGSEMPSTIISGMGLYGARYIVEHLGGAILYTTTFKDGNPVFTYILPRQPVASKEGAQGIRTQMINGQY